MTKYSWPNAKVIITMGVYLTHGLSVSNPRLKGTKGRLAGQTPRSAGHVLCQFDPRLRGNVSTRSRRPRRWRKSVEAAPPSQPNTTWCQTDISKSVELPHVPINTPLRWKWGDTPHFGDSTCKALILRVEGRCGLIKRVERLWGPEGLPSCREPSSWLECGISVGIIQGPIRFLGSSLVECGSSAKILWILTKSLCSSTLGEVGVPAYQDHSASIPQNWVIYLSQ
jgi:hypothetical protein